MLISTPCFVVLIIFNLVAELCTSLKSSYNVLGLKLADVIIYCFCELVITIAIISTNEVPPRDVQWNQSSETSETPTMAKGEGAEHPHVTNGHKTTGVKALP
jgi:hypothetical protein